MNRHSTPFSSSAKLGGDMSSTNSPQVTAPPSMILSFSPRSRRGSLASLSGSSVIDKEQLAQALNAIHNTASQSETLTTFNEFASPPSASSPSENKGIAGDLLHNGFSGLYSRFRGAVGAGKDRSGPAATKDPAKVDGDSPDSSSIRSQKTTTPATKPSSNGHTKDVSVTTASSIPLSRSSSRQSPTATSFTGVGKPGLSHISKATPSSSLAPVSVTAGNERGRLKETSESIASRVSEHSLAIRDSSNFMVASQVSDSGYVNTNDNSLTQESSAAPWSSRTAVGVDGPSDVAGAVGNEPRARSALSNGSQAIESRTGLLHSERGSKHTILADSKRSNAIERITQAHLPNYLPSRTSSTDRSVATTSPVTTSAHNSLYHEVVGSDDWPGGAGPRHIPGTTTNEGNPEVVSARLEQMRKQVLSKEYWMADELCKECFLCGDNFTAFRRKHHCRTCGCIFDSKCTSIISGERFGVNGSLRVCKTCLDIINRRHDSSDSDDSGDDTVLPTSFFRPRLPRSEGIEPEGRSISIDDMPVSTDMAASRPLATPMMAIPATRRIGDSSNRRSAVLEIDAPQLSRPSSSRSLKSLTSGRPPSSGHRRYQSRHNFLGRFRSNTEQRAPFHRDPVDERKHSRLPAFHDDNIIDPDLAPYMSDEGSSGDEQMSIFAAMNSNDVSSPRVESERTGFSTLLGPGKKHRSRAGDKSVGGVSFVSRPNDDNGSTGSFMGHTRPTRRRNASASSNNIHHGKGSPRQNKVVNFMKGVEDVSEEYSGSFENLRETSSPGRGPNKMTRSVSMRDANAPAVELNNASLHHVRRLLHQMLQDANIPNVPSWEKALIPILLRCTDDVNPDVRSGDDIDIRHYVKLKRVPGGKPGDTSYVSGVVFTKNLALKSMPRSISHPRIVIVSFPIEYQRHQQHFMSLEPVIAQEKEFLRNMVNRIASLRPQLVLVQKHISGLALQYLSEANIAVAYNVKQSVIEAVSRCAQTEIISSIDMVALKPVHVGKSTGFDVKTYVHQDIPGRKKTCIYISGCPKELGCTIVLRGASMPVLHQMKRITEFMVYVVYNLKLETCLMRDEFVLLPSVPDNGGSLSPGRQQASNAMATESNEPATARFAIASASDKMHAVVEASKKLQQLQSSNGDGGGNQPGAQEPARSSEAGLADEKNEAPASIPPSPKLVSAHASHAHDTPGEDAVPEDIPMPTFYSDMVAKHQTKILSASPFVKFMQPYLLVRAREQERRLIYLKRLRDQDTFEDLAENEKATPQKFQLIQPEMVHATVQGAPKSIMEILHAVHDAEYDKALHNYETQKRQWENYIQGNLNLFDPYAHQNIVVLYTVVCTATTVPCAGPELLALAFYNEHETIREFDPDCTLGQYVEDLCLSVDTVCTSNGCERKMTEHHRTYVHGEARITVFLEKTTCKIKGLQDSILMWSYCKICKKESQVMPMSESTWKYSFGKYLELSFWSTELRLRAGFCPHDLHKDHLRYFGYRNVAMRIHYDPIDLLEIVVPRTRITWKVDKDLRLKNELFTKSEERWNRFMASVKSRIKGININNVGIENAEACKAEVDKLTKRAHDEHSALLRKLQEKYMESKYYEIIPLNRAVRAMQEKVAEWDSAFADFDSNYFPSEKDIRRLATLQLKKMFMDSNSSSTSLTSLDTIEQSDIDEQSNFTVDTDTLNTSKEDSQDASQSSVGETSPETSNDNARAEPSSESSLDHERDGVQHLDLAVTHSNQNNEAANDVTPTMESNNPMYHNNAVSEPALNEDRPSPTPITPVETSLSEKVMLLRKASHASSGAGAGNSESSGIPKPSDRSIMRRSGSATSPPISRTQSQPIATLRRLPPPNHRPYVTRGESKQGMVLDIPDDGPRNTAQEPAKERKITDRLLGLGKHRKGHHSLIPRSIQGKRKDSKVANLANIYEQISREFEKERMRDRRQQAAKVTQSRAFPKASSKPIVEVYRDVNAAVEEQGHPEDDLSSMEPSHLRSEPSAVVEGLARTNTNTEHESATSPTNTAATAEETVTEPETDDNQANASQTASDDENASDVDHSLIDGMPDVAEIADSLGSSEPSTELELPKHEKSSLMKMLTNFWAERSASGWTQLEYPLSASDHVFVDSDVIVREDEPSSLIAFALSSEDYVAKLETIRRQGRPSTSDPNAMMDPESPQSYFDNPDIDQTEVETSLLRATGTHLKYQFAEGSAKMLCKIFYAEQFDAVRRKCGVSDRIVESLSRCLKWDSKGGKTKSVFLKTLDDRLVLKSLSPIETQAFLRFAPAYFNIMAEALFHDLPTVIAKMLGFYQIVIKNPVTGTEIKWDVLVMENLFYDRSPTRIFDLKGSMRNRKIQSTGEQNEVLLDENMVEFIYESPLFAREHSKKLLRASVWNDTLFLARQDVMDYSLMVAVDEDRKELVVGIIDCIRTYTWDKKLESWIKDRGFAGGNRNRPTVTSPKEYKSRFREAMARYVLQAPNCWHQFTTQPDGRQSNADPHHDALEEKTQDD